MQRGKEKEKGEKGLTEGGNWENFLDVKNNVQ